jgi:hypothetical protein
MFLLLDHPGQHRFMNADPDRLLLDRGGRI